MKKLLLFSMIMGSVIAVDSPVYHTDDMFIYAFGKYGEGMSKVTQDLLKRCRRGNSSFDKKACKAGKALFDNAAKACEKKAQKEEDPFKALWYLGYGRPSYSEDLKRTLINRG